jgi:predicted DNA-binding transcriptional regulator YafY
MGRVERLNLLRRLASRRGTISHAEYAAALRGRVSPRQASRDLQAASFLRKEGRTRGSRYRLVTGSPADPPAPAAGPAPGRRVSRRPRRPDRRPA